LKTVQQAQTVLKVSVQVVEPIRITEYIEGQDDFAKAEDEQSVLGLKVKLLLQCLCEATNIIITFVLPDNLILSQNPISLENIKKQEKF